MNYGEQVDHQKRQVAEDRASVRRYFSNRNALEAVMADIATGTKPTDIAARLGVSYQALYSVLTGSFKDQYKAARAAFADLLAEKNLDMADKVENLQMPADAAKTAAGLRQWHMERTAGEQWGQRSSMDVNHRGVVGLHLEAIRQLSSEPLEGEYAYSEELPSEEENALERPQGSGEGSHGGAWVPDADDGNDDGNDHMDGEGDSGVKGHPLL